MKRILIGKIQRGRKASEIHTKKRPYGNLETVDEFESRKEAINNLKEYRIYDTSAFYYLSQKLAEIGKKVMRRKDNG